MWMNFPALYTNMLCFVNAFVTGHKILSSSILSDIKIRGEAEYLYRSDKTRTANVLKTIDLEDVSKTIDLVSSLLH
jgi:hypothetical protein